jgi:predicted deacylase
MLDAPVLRSAAIRRRTAFIASALLATACAGLAAGPSRSDSPAPGDCCAAAAIAISGRGRVAAIAERRFTHAELWRALDPAARSPALAVREIGRSVQDRPIRSVTFGSGATTVLLWSQMHGDESTATMSLADLIAWFASTDPVHRELRERIASRLTVVMVPMLNPDGAERFQRENAVGIDINRDARRLATPEARALARLRDSIRADFGFNLHDQSARILAGERGSQVAIALLAPAADESRSWTPTRRAARLIAARIAGELQAEIPGRVARYNDAFEPRAFGDLMQQWGTSTVLIESGAIPGDAEKQRLRVVTTAAILAGLDAISGGYSAGDARAYEALPLNSRAAADIFVRGASLVLPGAEPVRADLTLNYEDPLAGRGLRIREVGDLLWAVAMDTIDASGLFLHPSAGALTAREGATWLRTDDVVELTVRRSADAGSEVVRTIGGGRGGP